MTALLIVFARTWLEPLFAHSWKRQMLAIKYGDPVPKQPWIVRYFDRFEAARTIATLVLVLAGLALAAIGTALESARPPQTTIREAGTPPRDDQVARSATVRSPDVPGGRAENQNAATAPPHLVPHIPASEIQLQSALEHTAKVDRFVWDGTRFLPRDSVERVRELDRVVHEESKTVQDPNAQLPVRYTTLKFENGLEVSFRTFGTPIQMQLTRVTVSSTKWPLNQGLGVGAPLARVREVLGTPDEASDQWIKYAGETEKVAFFVKDGRVSSVVFSYYAD